MAKVIIGNYKVIKSLETVSAADDNYESFDIEPGAIITINYVSDSRSTPIVELTTCDRNGAWIAFICDIRTNCKFIEESINHEID